MHSPDARPERTTVGDRYRVLLDIARTLAGTLGSDELYEAIYRETASVLEASGFFISLYDPGEDEARIVFFADRGEIQRDVDIRYSGAESEVIRARTPVMVAERLEDHSLTVLGEGGSEVTRSAISAPMLHKGRILGAISAQSYNPHAYTEADLDLLQGIADLAGVAVDNAHQVAELDSRRREAEQIEEIGRAMAASLNAKDVLGKVIQAVTTVLNVDGASVWLRDGPTGCVGRVAESGGEIALPIDTRWDLSGPLAETLIDQRAPVILEDLAASPHVPDELRDTLKAGSGIGVPLFVGGKVAGVLTAGSRKVRHFLPDDVAVLIRLASQASVALENARLHANLQALTLTDPLTNLPNRRRLQIHLDKEVAAARRGRSLVVVLFDVDDFKHYNDTLGHIVGDEILRRFGVILEEENRAMNLVARYGGDEFVSVLSESHMDGAHLYVKRVTNRVVNDEVLSGYGVTVSIGLAEFDRGSMKTPEDVMAAADADMYRAKGSRERKPGRRAASP
ncbi:MAG: sensor domain-containing diguanylate cyclase [Longimicrobiales bacterium]